jgi:hypothetical protein
MNDLLHAFPGQEVDEPVYVFARPYPVVFFATAGVFFLLFIFGLGLQYALSSGFFSALSPEQTNIGILFIGLFELFVLVIFLTALLDFYYDILIVTDRRVVDIDQEVLFYRKVAQLSLENVEDVNSVIQKLLGTVFTFGKVEIQTAGSEENFIVQNIHYPDEIAAIVLDLSDQAKRGVPDSQRIPTTPYLAVINNKRITTVEELKAVGAILPDDFRRVPRNAA